MADAISGTRKSFGYFSKVKEAREYLKSQTMVLLELQKTLILEAAAKGEFEAALKANQWLIEHTAGEDGVRVIDPSAAKPQEVEGYKGPQIAIGINLGTTPKALPELKVIDVVPDE